jgi:hypothetical protein
MEIEEVPIELDATLYKQKSLTVTQQKTFKSFIESYVFSTVLTYL